MLLSKSRVKVFGSWVMVGAALRGAAHQLLETGCQDSFEFKANDTLKVIAVADGVGSCSMSHLGSSIAVRTVMEMLVWNDYLPVLESPELMMVVFSRVHRKLRKVATKKKLDVVEFSSTLLVLAWNDERAVCGHIGDGAIVVETTDKVVLLSPPEQPDITNVTSVITAGYWREALRIGSLEGDIKGVALFTDGLHKAALLPPEDGRWELGDKFVQPLFDAIREDPDTAGWKLPCLLSSPKIGDFSDDDKTIVVGVKWEP